MHVVLIYFLRNIADVLTLATRCKHSSSWENSKKGNGGYSQSSCWFMNANAFKGLLEGFNELCVLCFCRRWMTLQISFFHYVKWWWRRGKGGEHDALHCTAGDRSCYLSTAVLLTIAWLFVLVVLTPYLPNDHFPVKGPSDSYYPWSDHRWQGKGMDVTWQPLCFLTSDSCLKGRLTSPTHTKNPHSNKSNQVSSASNAGITFSFLASCIFTHSCARSMKSRTPVVWKITSRSDESLHATCSMTFGCEGSIVRRLKPLPDPRAACKAAFFIYCEIVYFSLKESKSLVLTCMCVYYRIEI